MNIRVFSQIVLGGALLLASALAAGATKPAPEYWPLCQNPQNIAPLQAAGGWSQSATAVAWNGKEYGVAWTDFAASTFTVYFRRFFADGTPGGPRVQVSTTGSYSAPHLVWNGASYGIAFCQSAPSGQLQIYFATLTVQPNGAVAVSAPLKVSHIAVPETTDAYDPTLAWSGNGYAVVWDEQVGSNYDVHATLLDASGNLSGILYDIVLCDATGHQAYPTIAWVSGRNQYWAAWLDERTSSQVYGNFLTPSGSTGGTSGYAFITASTTCHDPSIAGMGSGFGLAWEDGRDSGMGGEIYFTVFDGMGNPVTADTRLSSGGAGGTLYPWLLWTGAEFDVFFADQRAAGGSFGIWQQSVSFSGTPSGGNNLVTSGPGFTRPGAAFARYGFLVAANAGIGLTANFVQSVGCNSDWTPPSCPMNLVAYNVTGSAASIGWIPSVEDYTDMAYYEVYRNSALLGITSNAFYNDTGLSLSTTYNYYVRPVNAAQVVNGTCTNSIYVKTNATLTLMLNKNNPDAHLTWSDIALNNYNVFRGTSPQVMSQIGSTGGCQFDDANVLVDNVLYFYTVDEPGL